MRKFFQICLGLMAFAGISSYAVTTPSPSLTWEPKHVQAKVENVPLSKLLEDIATATGWEVYMEPGTTFTASAKFKDLPETEALQRLLGNLSFSLTPQTNSARKLYVFKTKIGQATQLVRAPLRKGGRIARELVVGLKPGTSIDDLAKKLGAKIVGRNDRLHAYRLQFPDDDSADKALQALHDDDEVTGVESNFAMDEPPRPAPTPVAATAMPSFNLKANPDPNHLVVGLIDTHMQQLDPSMQQFVLGGINEAGQWTGGPDDPTHGTFMAETILHALQLQMGTSGQNSSARILPVDVYGNNAQTTTYDVANGIVAAIQNGAQVINLSLGSSGDSSYLSQVIASASKQGIIFIAAAGNTPVTSPTFPAADTGVLAVTASDSSGNLADYANRGSFVDVIFPGTDVGKIGTTAYQVNGTSTATAFASGTAAALMQQQRSPGAAMTYLTSNFAFKNK